MYVSVCVIVMKLSVEISLSNVELTRNCMQEKRIKNNTVTCFVFWKNLCSAGFVNLSTTDLLGRVIFCRRRLSWVLHDF